MPSLFLIGSLLFCFPTRTVSVKYESCADKYPQCKQWKEQGFCSDVNYKEYMLRVCQESCNICDLDSTSDLPDDRNVNRTDSFRASALNSSSPSKTLSETPSSDVHNSTLPSNTSVDDIPDSSNNSQEIVSQSTPQAIRLIESITKMLSKASVQELSGSMLGGKHQKQSGSSQHKDKVEHSPHKKENFFIPLSKRDELAHYNSLKKSHPNKDETLRILLSSKKSKIPIPKKHTRSKHKMGKDSTNKKDDLTNSQAIQNSPVDNKPKKPIKPDFSSKPFDSSDTDDSVEPPNPTEQTDQSDPNDSSQSSEPTEPSDPNETPDPTEPSDPNETPDTTEPSDPNETLDTTEPSESTESSDQSKLSEDQTYQSAENQNSDEEDSQNSVPTTLAPQATPVGFSQDQQQAELTAVSVSPTIAPIPQQDEEGSKFSLIIKQPYKAQYSDTESSEYKILVGNFKQDLEYTLGSDTQITEVKFSPVAVKSDDSAYTQANFVIYGLLDNLDELRSQVNSGKVNGLKVKPNSLIKE